MISVQLLATYAACPRPESQLWNHQEVFSLFIYFLQWCRCRQNLVVMLRQVCQRWTWMCTSDVGRNCILGSAKKTLINTWSHKQRPDNCSEELTFCNQLYKLRRPTSPCCHSQHLYTSCATWSVNDQQSWVKAKHNNHRVKTYEIKADMIGRHFFLLWNKPVRISVKPLRLATVAQ